MKRIKQTGGARKIDPRYVAEKLGAKIIDKKFFDEDTKQFKDAMKIVEEFRIHNLSNPFIDSVYGFMKLYRKVSEKQYHAILNTEDRALYQDDEWDHEDPWYDTFGAWDHPDFF